MNLNNKSVKIAGKTYTIYIHVEYRNSLKHFQSLIDTLAMSNVIVMCMWGWVFWVPVRGCVLLGVRKLRKMLYNGFYTNRFRHCRRVQN